MSIDNKIEKSTFMGFKWSFLALPNAHEDEQIRKEFHTLAGTIGQIKARLLFQKGLMTKNIATQHFKPAYESLHDPMLMRDMPEAVARLKTAIENNEKIRLYGDYDVDGTTAIAVIMRTLGKKYDHLDYYISDRYKEGYGVSQIGIEKAKEDGINLLITLDCGIRAHEKVELAKSYGIDVIICDHHEPVYPLPSAIAVLDIKRKDCEYPYKSLSGCGVGFKMMQALGHELGWEQSLFTDVLELLSISIAADIVPMKGENHTLMRLGLEQLASSASPGIECLMEVNGVFDRKNDRVFDTNDLVFGIAPSINAAGRLEHASDAVKLMIEKDPDKALERATNLRALNEERKKLDSEITKQALAIVDIEEGFETRNTTVVYNPEWHKGVVGIVASRMQEKHYRPTIVFTQTGENTITGSARSVQQFNLLEALDDCSDFLSRYGGHAFAAGLSMDEELLDHFKVHFEEVVKSRMTEGQVFQEPLDINLVLDYVEQELGPKEISSLINFIERMGPFGPENWQPIFYTEQFVSKDKPFLIKKGEGEGHLKMNLSQESLPYSIPAIAFGMGEWQEKLWNRPFSACYYLESNFFRGKKSPQIRIKDIKL